MTLTLEVSGKIAEQLALLPEGEPRNKQALAWLEQVAEEEMALDAAFVYTEEQDRRLGEAIAASDSGRRRPLKDSLADFRKRREQEREVMGGQVIK